MKPENPPGYGRLLWKAGAVAFVLGCVLVDFVPHHDAPAFRYTGSDPGYAVWNLGWPLTLFIYDPRSGLHVGPSAYVVLPLQLLLVAVVFVAVRIGRRRGLAMRQTARMPGGAGE